MKAQNKRLISLTLLTDRIENQIKNSNILLECY